MSAQDQPWTIRTTLAWTQGHLAQKGDVNPRLSAQWLLCYATALTRLDLYLDFDRPLSPAERATLREAVKRRAAGEPLQYIIGTAPFRHLDLQVRPGVLIPRPETELLVDLVLTYLDVDKGELPPPPPGPHNHPLSTGTRCNAQSLLHEHPQCHVAATDIDPQAVGLAQANAQALKLDGLGRLHIAQDDLAASLLQGPANHQAFDVVVSNPPYIPTAQLRTLPQEVAAFEPVLALDGGASGLAIFKRIIDQARVLLRPGGLLACELHEDTVHQAAALCAPGFTNVTAHQDLTGRDRFITAQREGMPQ
ncbi:MAG: peptide chain release factor N(5)-glutamine methyltransferase [Coriobacteriales bacterium]|jgi:release factor-specific protein-(glutamine-N5) methyltransferase|nr:peptide chain release factor N(5)-glutamine methyltransferase [Coriobacteriales bacterium]